MSTRVQANVLSGNGTSAAHTLTSTGSNNLLYAVWLSAGAPTTLVDSAGGSLAGGQWQLRESTSSWAFYDRLACPAGIVSVTASFASADYLSWVGEYTGTLTFDNHGENDGPGAVTSWTSNNVAVSSSTGIAFGFAATFSGSAQNFAAGSGWTAESGTGLTAGGWSYAGGDCAFVESRALSGSGNYAATGTCTSSYVYAILIAYGEAAADTLMGQGAF